MKAYKVYISGKTTAEDYEDCSAKFREIENKIREAGAVPVTPFTIGIPFDVSTDEAVIHCRKAIRQCHAIFMLDDHVKCRRARLEVELAVSLKLDHYCDCETSFLQIQDLVSIRITG